MQNSKGFTLIEMVVVIVILGILAATAAPRFLNIQSDARESSLEGFIGAFKAANEMVHSKAILNGVEHTTENAIIPGTNITVNNGYMVLNDDTINEAMDLSGLSFTWFSDGYEAYFYLGEETKKLDELYEEKCFVLIQRTKEDDLLSPPAVFSKYDGC